jgi:AcrR family transcriptional regulator
VSHSLSTVAPVTRSQTGRARPLPPEERRAALIAATVPLVCELGTKVTTRQIAEAAGVAEGTIFRVFDDKDELVSAAVGAVLDPVPLIAELDGIDRTLPLRERMTALVGVMQRRLLRVFGLLSALGMVGPPDQLQEHKDKVRPTNEMVFDAVERILAPDRDRFRCPIREVAHILRLVTFSGSHPLISDGRMLTAEQIVSVVLDGLLEHDDLTHDDPQRSSHRGNH